MLGVYFVIIIFPNNQEDYTRKNLIFQICIIRLIKIKREHKLF